jgi:hypothetical protein
VELSARRKAAQAASASVAEKVEVEAPEDEVEAPEDDSDLPF